MGVRGFTSLPPHLSLNGDQWEERFLSSGLYYGLHRNKSDGNHVMAIATMNY